jgi:type IX secretion system PorP/SprF family membrane protein
MKFLQALFVFAFSVLLWTQSNAQQEADYVQYWAAQQFYNPAYMGSNYDMEFTAIARRPWIELGNSPFYGVASLGLAAPKLKGAVGGSFWYNGIGSETDIGAKATYSFHKAIGTGFLNVGGSIGMINKRVAVNLGTGNVGTNGVNQTVLDAEFGIYYHTPQLFLGYSITHPHEPAHSNLGSEYIWYRQHHLMGGATIEAGDMLIKPGTGYHFIYNSEQGGGILADVLDVNLQAQYMERFWAGLLYRKNGTYGVNVGIMFDRINLGYAFDRTPLSQGFIALTSHEFFLTYYLRKPEPE